MPLAIALDVLAIERTGLHRRLEPLGVGEGADRHRDHSRPPLDLVADGDAACAAEAEAGPEALVGATLERGVASGDRDSAGGVMGVPGEGRAAAALLFEQLQLQHQVFGILPGEHGISRIAG